MGELDRKVEGLDGKRKTQYSYFTIHIDTSIANLFPLRLLSSLVIPAGARRVHNFFTPIFYYFFCLVCFFCDFNLEELEMFN